MLFPLIETNALYAYTLSDLDPLLRTCVFMCALSLSHVLSLLCALPLSCVLSLSLSLLPMFSVHSLFLTFLCLSLYLAMLMATSSLAVLVWSRKSWLSRVGRNWTYTPVSTASSDWGANTAYQSLHNDCPPYHSHSMTTALLITVTP